MTFPDVPYVFIEVTLGHALADAAIARGPTCPAASVRLMLMPQNLPLY